jgi:hypothetical protein
MAWARGGASAAGTRLTRTPAVTDPTATSAFQVCRQGAEFPAQHRRPLTSQFKAVCNYLILLEEF